ncbi:tyrosine--tRNA ligase 2, cytoplasmic-like [Triticum dicoccoides]|uniref:tyrosine--tRNA ligase 2, cytoplasmic-like n=1 Tax=Triticum dicoccoides TaxID=85692 RepID=UPI0018901210|nr:tyrosine--tRNA ligase 2, cytoplasmic-like [Triticum dicoccoides]
MAEQLEDALSSDREVIVRLDEEIAFDGVGPGTPCREGVPVAQAVRAPIHGSVDVDGEHVAAPVSDVKSSWATPLFVLGLFAAPPTCYIRLTSYKVSLSHLMVSPKIIAGWLLQHGISMTINDNKLVKAGCEVKMLMADWFALMDPKIGGNICKVQTIGRYNIEMPRASGMNLDGVEFVQLSDLISCHAEEYWPVAMDIAKNSNLSEIKRCFSIHASEDARVQFYYFQRLDSDLCKHGSRVSDTLDVFLVDIWMLGMDQRGANIKIENSFCPPKFAEDNPCLEYIKYIILPWFRKFEVARMDDNSCSKIFLSMEEIIADYQSGALHPADLKVALIKATNLILQPVRDHFRSSAEAKEIAKAMEVSQLCYWLIHFVFSFNKISCETYVQHGF